MRGLVLGILEEIKTESEMNGYIQEFECWLQLITDNKNITSGCLSFVNDYWKCSFKDWLHKLCQCYYHSVNMGYIITSIYSEVENSRLKRSALGTRPNHTIDVAQDAITNVSIAAIDSLLKESHLCNSPPLLQKRKKEVCMLLILIMWLTLCVTKQKVIYNIVVK